MKRKRKTSKKGEKKQKKKDHHFFDKKNQIKIISWNVNGLNAMIKKKKGKYFKKILKENPSIICLQETKLNKDALPNKKFLELVEKEYRIFYNSCKKKKGYSGIATLVLKDLITPKIQNGMGKEKYDNEGRNQTLDFDTFFLQNTYTPNSGYELKRLNYRLKWDKKMFEYLEKLIQKKPVIWTGDLNCSHEEEDVWEPKKFKRKPGFTDEERGSFNTFMKKNNFFDAFRLFHSGEKDHFSFWSYRGRQRDKNQGFHPDLFIISEKLKEKVQNSYILKNVKGSDHAPVGLIINL